MRVLFHTFGCKANQYDTEVVRQGLERAGCAVVETAEQADAAVVNSCAVTAESEAKLRGFVRHLARARPGIRTVVIGCAAALDSGRIAALPSVAAVVAGADPEEVGAALGVECRLPAPLDTFRGSSRAWLKVQDGCDEHCTFCATTLARGASRSRTVGELVEEARRLASHHAEIVLTGVHIGSYGADLPAPTSLGRLVEELVERVPDVRFRLSSLEATEVDERIERLMSGARDRLAPHLHAPLQSGSDRILKLMGRHWYTARAYRARLERLASLVQPLGLGADVIAGFPGETAEDHAATLALVEALPYTYLHVFPWSARPGTAAQRLGPSPDGVTVRSRCRELRELAAEKARAHAAARCGDLADVVLERRSGGWRGGVSEDYLGVKVRADAPWALGRRRARVMLRLDGGAMVGEAA